jgi:hypothetical protein
MTRTAPAACDGVGNVFAVHRRPALCVARAFQVDVSDGSTNDSGNQWQGAFKRSFTLGASRSVCSEIVSEAEAFPSVGVAVTVTVLFSSAGFSWEIYFRSLVSFHSDGLLGVKSGNDGLNLIRAWWKGLECITPFLIGLGLSYLGSGEHDCCTNDLR